MTYLILLSIKSFGIVSVKADDHVTHFTNASESLSHPKSTLVIWEILLFAVLLTAT